MVWSWIRPSDRRRGRENPLDSLPPIVPRSPETGKPREEEVSHSRGKGRFTELASTRARQTRERHRRREGGERGRVDFHGIHRAIASPGTRGFARCGALPIKFRGLTRRRYCARSTKTDNSIPHRSREERENERVKKRRRGRGESMEKHGVVFRRGSPGFVVTPYHGIQFAIFPWIHPRSLSAHLLLSADDAASLERRECGYMHRLEALTGVSR